MKLYCKVENDSVVMGPTNLPLDLQLLSDFDLLDLGWRVTERILPDTFEDRKEIMEIEFTVLPFKVIATYTKRLKTERELKIDSDNKRIELNNELEFLKSYVMALIESTDYQELPSEIQAEWIEYREIINSINLQDITDMDVWDYNFPNAPQFNNTEIIVS